MPKLLTEYEDSGSDLFFVCFFHDEYSKGCSVKDLVYLFSNKSQNILELHHYNEINFSPQGIQLC